MEIAPLFSVVIPARNGKDKLAATLDSIAATDFDLSRIEVIVVDDGSTDGTYESFRDRRYPFEFRIHRESFGNQSAATNAAIRDAGGTFVLSSAQDIIFERNLFREHLKLHERFDGEEITVLGYLPYARDLDVTPFMFYLVSGGYQFAYYLIADSHDVPPNFLYAPNFSMRRDVLEAAGGFDERFPFGCQDIDLGIRLRERGVRIVYNAHAIGFHNHPVDLEGYCRRQETVGRAVVNLGRKHPDHEGGLQTRDAAIRQYLMCSDMDLDRARLTVRELETTLSATRHPYRTMWSEAFGGSRSVDTFSDDERRTLETVDRLFHAYATILGYHWAYGYLSGSIEIEGAERVEQWVRARLLKSQTSIPVKRTLERRLRGLGIDLTVARRSDPRVSLVAHDIDDYAAALRVTEKFSLPKTGRFGQDLVVVVTEGVLSDVELERLCQIAEVVVCTDPDDGVLEAVTRCRGEITEVVSARIEPLFGNARLLAEQLFERMPKLAVAGGVLLEPAGAPVPVGTSRQVDVALPELCWLRTASVHGLLGRETRRERGASSWIHHLCRLASDDGQLILQVPELVARHRYPAAAVRKTG